MSLLQIEVFGKVNAYAQHAKGKLAARERVELLLDEGTFEAASLAARQLLAAFLKQKC